jgi:hypothetical protein
VQVDHSGAEPILEGRASSPQSPVRDSLFGTSAFALYPYALSEPFMYGVLKALIILQYSLPQGLDDGPQVGEWVCFHTNAILCWCHVASSQLQSPSRLFVTFAIMVHFNLNDPRKPFTSSASSVLCPFVLSTRLPTPIQSPEPKHRSPAKGKTRAASASSDGVGGRADATPSPASASNRGRRASTGSSSESRGPKNDPSLRKPLFSNEHTLHKRLSYGSIGNAA